MKKIKIQRKTVYHNMKKPKIINKYMNKDGIIIARLSSKSKIKEYYNENNDIEMIKGNNKIISIRYNKKGNVQGFNAFRIKMDNTILYNLYSVISYNENNQINEIKLSLQDFSNNTISNNVRNYEYTDSEIISYNDKDKVIYTLDNKVKKSISTKYIIEYTYDENNRRASKKITNNETGNIENYTYEYYDNGYIVKDENDGIVYKYLLNENGDIIERRNSKDELMYTCEYEYYEE